LTSPACYNNGTTRHISPSQQVDTGSTMEASFGIDPVQEDFRCFLSYKLQRKYATRTVNKSNSSTVPIENTATNMYLLVALYVKVIYQNFSVRLIECNYNFTWDEDKLWAFYKQYSYIFSMDYEYKITTWLIDDDAVMKISHDITYRSDYKLDIIISEGIWKHNMRKPVKLDPNGLVSSLSMLIVLIYTVRLFIRPSFKLNIHNQCLNVDLISPTNITANWLDCHRPPYHKVCAGDTMKSNFIIKLNNVSDKLFASMFNVLEYNPYAALIYRLQRRRSHESIEVREDTSSSACLLVIWKIKYKKLYADVLLVEHEKGFDWNKDDLEKVRDKNFDQFRPFSDSATNIWALDDSMALMTTFKIMNEDLLLDITISEVKRDNSAWMPVYIDLGR
jgi:hypothetical protein